MNQKLIDVYRIALSSGDLKKLDTEDGLWGISLGPSYNYVRDAKQEAYPGENKRFQDYPEFDEALKIFDTPLMKALL